MGGDIQVERTPGRGSTFTALLRLRCSAEQGPPAAPAPIAARHVLLALDRPTEARALRLALQGVGVPVEAGATAAAGDLIAAAVREYEPFTTLIVDGRGGPQKASLLLAHARAADADAHGVVILDTAAQAEFSAFREAGFAAYLVRPVRPRSLLAHLAARPVSPDARDAGAPLAAAVPAPARRVLVVEDNDINSLLARRMLEKAGCTIRVVRNGHDALEAMRRVLAGLDAPVDLVLMDVHMPVLDGLDATRRIHELFAGAGGRPPPIVAVTANAFEEDRRRCLDAGMDDYLAKPFDQADLERLLARWCGEASVAA
jgi:CheY-like chemotaxis protein